MKQLAVYAAFALIVGPAVAASCSAAGDGNAADDDSQSTTTGAGGAAMCGDCLGETYIPCNADGSPGEAEDCPEACSPTIGCTACVAGNGVCVGNEVHQCTDVGEIGGVVQPCNVAEGEVCADGRCRTACEVAADQPSNVGCQFWAVDLDQQDALNNPAVMPWGVVLSNASDAQANVTIERNDAPPGSPPAPVAVSQVSVAPGQLQQVILETREVDCGATPNDYTSPGTCLSSRAFRITSSAPIVVYQFNVFENAFSNDASLLLPTNALGRLYRVINWSAGHPAPTALAPNVVDRSYVTIVGTEEGTTVTVRPTWRIRGNPPIDPTAAGETIDVTLGPFDVLNLETDNATLVEAAAAGVADLTGTTVNASKPVAVFSGVESTGAPYHVTIPEPPDPDSCCLDHLEEQMFPLESIGKTFVITRSPIRSTGSYIEPDVLRFVGAAAPATVTTTLPAPLDSFTIAPGEIVDTWTTTDITVSSTEPVLIGQVLVSQGYVDGPLKGDPSLTVFPPVEQYRTEYVFLTPGSWIENWVVIAAPEGATVTIDDASPAGCVVASAGTVGGTTYEARRCPLDEGAHRLSGTEPFGIVAYGYGSAGSYAFAGGADVERIYEVPPLR